MKSEQEPREVEVRIPVVVCACGQWVASGWSGGGDDEARAAFWCRCKARDRVLREYFVAARIARPEPLRAQEVPGNVSGP